MSCLFSSLSVFLKIDDYTIRQKICDYFENNLPIMEDIETKLILDLEDPHYIKKMRQTHIWGGSNEIKAACNIWKLKIRVHMQPTKRVT